MTNFAGPSQHRERGGVGRCSARIVAAGASPQEAARSPHEDTSGYFQGTTGTAVPPRDQRSPSARSGQEHDQLTPTEIGSMEYQPGRARKDGAFESTVTLSQRCWEKTTNTGSATSICSAETPRFYSRNSTVRRKRR